jgi:nucleoside-diphosphate-sugar epimerase
LSTYLVTGAAGFIGSNIVAELVARGETVRAVDNLSTGRRRNIEPFLSHVEFIEGDIGSPEVLERALPGADFVIHQAALPSVPRSIEDPIASNHANIDATLQLLVAARDARVKRLVFASSSSVYGDTPTLPKHEAMPTGPLSPYAVSKLAGEDYCRVFTHVYGLPTVALRYFNVFGPRQDPTSQYAAVIPAFITAMLEGRAPTIYGDGEQSRDFTYVGNVVEANLLACRADAAVGHAINIACGVRTSLLELVAAINRNLGTNIRPNHEPARTGDIKHSLADITRARELLGFEPATDFDAGLARTIDSLRQAARPA